MTGGFRNKPHIVYPLKILKSIESPVRFEVFTAVTMKSVLWDVTPCGSFKNRRFGGT
jgi:hypothetical protein